jgi:hypothetical protein
MKMHKGTLTVHSEGEGFGSVFIMSLPCMEGAPLSPTSAMSLNSFSSGEFIDEDDVDDAFGYEDMVFGNTVSA